MSGTFHHEAEAICSQKHLQKSSLCDKVRCQEEYSSLCGHHPGPKEAGKLLLAFKWNSDHYAFHSSKLSPETHFLPTTSGSSNLMVNLV